MLLELYIKNRWNLDEKTAKEIAELVDVLAQLIALRLLEVLGVVEPKTTIKVMRSLKEEVSEV